MAEYTYKDVIIDPEDPRVEIGKEYYFANFPSACISKANSNVSAARLYDIDVEDDCPFRTDDCGRVVCIIRKKEPKYVPFDLGNEEDRARLRGAWIRIKDIPNIEYLIYGLNAKFVLLGCNVNVKTDELLKNYEFIDGTPCGRLVEE